MKNDTKKIAFPAMRCFRMMGNATMKIRYSGNIIPFTGSLSCPVRAERKSKPDYMSLLTSSATNCTLGPMTTCTEVLLGRMIPATPADLIFFSSTAV